MSGAGERIFIDGGAGRIETVIDRPEHAPRGVALVAHPHPLYGGTLDNKVVQTLARTFVELGYVSLRPNFRGVGASEGAHDEGRGETEDLLSVVAHAGKNFGGLPLALAGFSFGAVVQTQVAQRTSPHRVVLVGVAVGRFPSETVPPDSIVIHGEVDETIPLAKVLDWARPQDLPVVVIPGADHFFHLRLNVIKSIVKNSWQS
ncbi:MAG TPA: CocE/NonD family hydrolase [Burkholderiales bacterium]|jgi:alpha/beta superfamily hydrolase|nr:CocE/NonD family hydrolase [Burkholderiales bacterium]